MTDEMTGQMYPIPEGGSKVAITDTDPFMRLISEAVSGQMPLETINSLLDLRDREEARQAKAAFTRAFANMQPALPSIAERGVIKNSQGKVQSTYALWEDVNEQIKPVLKRYGFSLSFDVDTTSQIKVTAFLTHVDGHERATSIVLPVDASQYRNVVQSTASSISYGKRYTAGALLNLTSRGEDDDGQSAGSDMISEAQFRELQDLIDESNSDIQRFTQYMGIPALKMLPANRFDDAKRALQAAKAKHQAKGEPA